MKDRARIFPFSFLKFAGLMIVVSAIPALAQFEVAPDHFDPTPAIEKKQAAKRSSVKSASQSSASSVSRSGQKQTAAATPVTVANNRNHAAGENAGHRNVAQHKNTSTLQRSANRKKQTGDENLAIASRR